MNISWTNKLKLSLPFWTKPARSVSTSSTSISTLSQGILSSTASSYPSMSRTNRLTVGLPTARRREYSG